MLDRKNPHSHIDYYNQLSERLWEVTTEARAQANDNTTYTSLVRLSLSGAAKVLSQQQVADSHNWSIRSLQQRLKDEGSSWQELVDEETIKRAKMLLSGGSSVDAVAESLGMSPSNFRRKFKHITGVSPKDYSPS